VFSNAGNFDAHGTATKIADLFLTAKEAAPPAAAAARKPEASTLAQYAGSYANPEGNPLQVVVADGQLQMDGGFGRTPLEAVSDSNFTAWGGHLKIAFAPPSGKGTPSPALTLTTNEPVRYTRYQPVKLTAGELAAYTGTFESDELDERYQVVRAGDSLLLRHRKYADVPLQAVTRKSTTDGCCTCASTRPANPCPPSGLPPRSGRCRPTADPVRFLRILSTTAPARFRRSRK
jgi:hypothetical protein